MLNEQSLKYTYHSISNMFRGGPSPFPDEPTANFNPVGSATTDHILSLTFILAKAGSVYLLLGNFQT